ncbi:MAG: rhodanese-like domain-containing protein [Pirellulales bacterium]
MAKHSPRFLRISEQARANISETTIDEVQARLDSGETFRLIDVREESEWAAGHLPQAEHLGRGILERDIEERIPDTAAPIVLYCGGGYRSALAAQSLQQMGYTNVLSLAGGIRAWRDAGLKTEA